MASAAWRTAKWLVKHADELAPPAYLVLKELLDHDEDAAEPGWHRFIVRVQRATPAGTSEDYAQIKFDLISIPDAGSDNSWTSTQFTAVATRLDALLTVYKTYMNPAHTIKEYRAYRMRFNPADPGPGLGPSNPPRPFQMTGPPVYVLPKTTVGTASGVMAYQVAMSVTLKTGWPRHWGRVYMPGPGGALDANGRFGVPDRTAIANAFFDFQDDLATDGFLLCVPMTQLQKTKFHGLLGVNQIVVDDIPDVVRRRRPKAAASRVVGIE